MKKIVTVLWMTGLLAGCLVSVVKAGSPAPVHLGIAGNYAILAQTGVACEPSCAITGDIGVSPEAATAITGFSLIMDPGNQWSVSSQVTGKVYAADYDPPTPTILTTAISNMRTAYTDAAGRAPDYTELYTGNMSGQTFQPGVYMWSTGVLITSDVILHGGVDDVFIFQIAQGITQDVGTQIILTGGVQARNIFWQASGTVSIGTGAHFEGILLAKTNIAIEANASIDGRLLAQTAVTLIQNTVVAPFGAEHSGTCSGRSDRRYYCPKAVYHTEHWSGDWSVSAAIAYKERMDYEKFRTCAACAAEYATTPWNARRANVQHGVRQNAKMAAITRHCMRVHAFGRHGYTAIQG